MKKYKFADLTSTLQNSIFTWDYFTNFNTVEKNMGKVEVQLNILNFLIGKENLEEEFIQLVRKYPEVRQALPLLIAVRQSKIKNMHILSNIEELEASNKYHIFYDDVNADIESELIIFMQETKLFDLIKNKKVKNLVDYCFGVEVGLDSHARKNRTGTLMENIVAEFLINFCTNNTQFSFIEQATQKTIKSSFDFDIQIDKSERKFDFALFDSSKNKIFLFEVNYYSGGGSKLKSTAGEYRDLYNFLKPQKIDLIWITDGLGWETALKPLEETFNCNEYLINLKMLKDGILNDICID